MVGGVNQSPRAAGVVRRAKRRHSVRAGPAVLGNRQVGQQGSGLGARVERGQVLSVADEALEHDARQVVGTRDAQLHKSGGRCRSRSQGAVGFSRRIDLGKQLPGQVEDRPVVDAEDSVPFRHCAGLGHISGVLHLRQVADASVARESLLEDHRVDEDRGGNSQHLVQPGLVVVLPQRHRDLRLPVLASGGRVAQKADQVGDAAFQDRDCLLQRAGRHPGIVHEDGQVRHATGKEAVSGEPSDLALGAGQERELQEYARLHSQGLGDFPRRAASSKAGPGAPERNH